MAIASRRVHKWTWLTTIFLINIAMSSAQTAWVAPGPVVGERFPPVLNLDDQEGRRRHVKDLLGRRGLVLVFVRSADWCPFCKRQLAELNARLPEFQRRDLAVASISVDEQSTVATFHQSAAIGFTMLADPKGRVSEILGIRDEQYPVGSAAFGVPHPMIFVIGKNGRIVAKFAEAGYRTRPDLDTVLAAIDALSF